MTKSNAVLAASLILSLLAAALSGVAVMTAGGGSAVTGTGGPAMSTSFGAEVRAYLLDNPEVIYEAAQVFDERQRATATNELAVAIRSNGAEILNSPTSPVTGNPLGDVTIVEFFDYNCPYCRAALPLLAEAMAADPGIRLVHKEWPILGAGSEFAALAALASVRQGQYPAFHQAMMGYSGAINETSTLEIARTLSLDLDQLRRDMEDAALRTEIERNFVLSGALRITGTPSFVVGDEIIRGLVDLEALQLAIARARAAGG